MQWGGFIVPGEHLCRIKVHSQRLLFVEACPERGRDEGTIRGYWLWLAEGRDIVGDEESNLVGTCRGKVFKFNQIITHLSLSAEVEPTSQGHCWK